MFQMAESYVKLNETDKALTTYKKVVTDYPEKQLRKESSRWNGSHLL